MADLTGKIIINRYRVDKFIDTGGMSTVYRVWDLERNQNLAMKVLRADLADDLHALERFQREARALEKLRHRNIVPFYGAHRSNDLVFLLEEYIDGVNLKQVIAQRPDRRLHIEECLIYLKAVCQALGYAHNNNVVHCDIKPGNVMIDRVGHVYLTDFGIARHADSTTTTLAGAGSPGYMAPEQIKELSVTPATDVYALGVMLFEMLTGQRPFTGNEPGTESRSSSTAAERVRFAHLAVDPPDPRSLNADIPERVAQTILCALEKDAQNRYGSALEMFEVLCSAMERSPSDVQDRVSPPTIDEPDPTPKASTGSSRGWIAGGAAVLVMLTCAFTLMAARLPVIQGLMATDTAIPSYTPLPSVTLAPTLTSTNTPIPSDTPEPPTATPYPTYTLPPTYTPFPTKPPPPTVAPTPEKTSFYIQNATSAAIRVWVDGVYVGEMSAGQIVKFFTTSLGQKTIKWCVMNGAVQGRCKTKSFNLFNSQDMATLN